jgi:FlaA1/EpsC-like NDP-sugar epimerase
MHHEIINTLDEVITYENVLNRKIRTIPFSASEILELRKEKILITGAAGSIGGRIVLSLSKIGGINYLATDRDESALHSLSLKLTSTALFEGDNFRLLDIRDPIGAQIIFEKYEPTVVIHAAALKHLSVLEKQPREALLTNVYGTLNMLEVAKMFAVRKFVNISTDKAASPVSVLGRSKFITELLTANCKNNEGYDFTSVRFGNVFGSRGSVIETFVAQIQKGMPLTLTDEEVARYFMHPDEAAFLTLKSMFVDKGDIHLFDMGSPVLIKEVIYRLLEILNGNSKITYTGLREGEKLNEDLFAGIEERTESIPGLIESSNHGETINRNSDLVRVVLSRLDSEILNYLTFKG